MFRSCRRSGSLISAARCRCTGFELLISREANRTRRPRASRRVGRTTATAPSCRPRGRGGTRGGGRPTGARREGRRAPGRGRVAGGRESAVSRSSLVAGSIWHARHRRQPARRTSSHREHSSWQAQPSACGRDRQSYRDCPVGDEAGLTVRLILWPPSFRTGLVNRSDCSLLLAEGSQCVCRHSVPEATRRCGMDTRASRSTQRALG